jgi:hypothetical protein
MIKLLIDISLKDILPMNLNWIGAAIIAKLERFMDYSK